MAKRSPCQNPPKPGWMASSPSQKCFEDLGQAGSNRKVPRTLAKPATMSAQAPHCAARSLSSLPEHTVSHTSRAIKYIFLKGCKNITASHVMAGAGTHKVYKGSVSSRLKVKHNPSTTPDCCPPLPEYLPIFSHFPMDLEKQAKGSGHFLASKKRLPVFQQLCGEAMPATALGDVHLQNSSQDLKELPDAKALKEDRKGWRMREAAECSPCNNGMN
ncbi:hypothetical protein llap_15482 [Limosa lapponica baueri]|uniref:Uncharacterized protein n=1 Tax=Limosa lapponica baueri TaxID=1758121 RepID=A0A2I0TK68_LIMLA|nr:hypothetical protein llap_15482 [Limosa lapponica baueri]